MNGRKPSIDQQQQLPGFKHVAGSLIYPCTKGITVKEVISFPCYFLFVPFFLLSYLHALPLLLFLSVSLPFCSKIQRLEVISCPQREGEGEGLGKGWRQMHSLRAWGTHEVAHMFAW